MRVWFCVESQVIAVEGILASINLSPDKIYKSGDRINNASKKIHCFNKVKFLLAETNEGAAVDRCISQLIPKIRASAGNISDA